MKQPPNKYWSTRADARMAGYHRSADATVSTITVAYDKGVQDINNEIEKIFKTFGTNGKMDPVKASKILNQHIPNPLLGIAKTIYPRIKNKRVRQWLLNKMNAPAYRARITRLQALKEQVFLQSKIIADAEITASTSGYIKAMNDAYYRTMFDVQKGLGVGFEFAAMSSRTVETILKHPWSGKHYSDRVWGNADVLATKLNEIITAGFESGAGTSKMTRELMEQMNVGKHAANRLVRTETTYMANAAELESYEEAEINQYQFLATLDLRTSPQCQEHDGKVFNTKDAVPGENMPPLHPFCRSTTIAYFGPDTRENIMRRARDPVTGKTELVPSNTNYEQWGKGLDEKHGKDRVDSIGKQIQNKAADKKQFDQYKELLGPDAPKSFAAFQEMKYSKGEEWSNTKALYRDVNWQVKAQENLVSGTVRKVDTTGAPNSVFDNYKNGNLDSRRYFGRTGKPRLDIDFTNHGNSKLHPIVPHAHGWDVKEESDKIERLDRKGRELTRAEVIANKEAIERSERHE